MASLIFQAFGVEDTAVSSMLQTIQKMKFSCGQHTGTQKRLSTHLSKLRCRVWVKAMGLLLQVGV